MRKTKPLSETGMITVNGAVVRFVMERSRKRKHTIAFKMERDSSLRVVVPASATLNTVTKIMQTHAPWVARRLELREQTLPVCDFTDGALLPYMGHTCRIRVTRGAAARQSCLLSPHAFHVHVPDEKLSDTGLREEAKLEISLWLKKRARVLFKKRLDLWAARLDVPYARLIIADQERRWGSCTVDNVIRLNWRLIVAPLSVIDYVVAHELCHVRHKDHSRRFWAFLEKQMPDWRARRKILRAIEQSPIL